ncbi:MAG: DUF6152 family protein [Pseudomonadota bacterium]|nr:DUF6152 family protein [Pseudomonadota bacterium]
MASRSSTEPAALIGRILRAGPVLAWLALAVVPASAPAHHSLSGQFDTARTLELTGVVSRVDWVNPHTYVYVDVKQPDGALLTWRIESLPVAMMRKAGLSKSELVGDGRPVWLQVHPSRGSDPRLGYLVQLRLADGKEIQFARIPGAEQP